MTDEQTQHSIPAEFWEYRNFKCALYRLHLPDDSRWIGYVRVGDEWTEAIDCHGTDSSDEPEQMRDRVEDKVDWIIRDALREEMNDLGPMPGTSGNTYIRSVWRDDSEDTWEDGFDIETLK